MESCRPASTLISLNFPIIAIKPFGGLPVTLSTPHIYINKGIKIQILIKSIFLNIFKYKPFKGIKDSHSLSSTSYSNLSK